MQPFANFALYSAQIGLYWLMWPPFRKVSQHPLPLAIPNQHQSFEYAIAKIHLPINPLGLIVKGYTFHTTTVFAFECIQSYKQKNATRSPNKQYSCTEQIAFQITEAFKRLQELFDTAEFPRSNSLYCIKVLRYFLYTWVHTRSSWDVAHTH